jgi:hypothetical protein
MKEMPAITSCGQSIQSLSNAFQGTRKEANRSLQTLLLLSTEHYLRGANARNYFLSFKFTTASTYTPQYTRLCYLMFPIQPGQGLTD